MEIKPLVRVGPIKLGMPRSLVQNIFSVTPIPYRKTEWSEHETDAFDDIRLHIFYTERSPTVEYIEIMHENASIFLLNGLDVFRTKSLSLVSHVCNDYSVIEEDPGYNFIYPAIELSLWRNYLSEPDEVDRFDAVGIGIKGYFSDSVSEQIRLVQGLNFLKELNNEH